MAECRRIIGSTALLLAFILSIFYYFDQKPLKGIQRRFDLLVHGNNITNVTAIDEMAKNGTSAVSQLLLRRRLLSSLDPKTVLHKPQKFEHGNRHNDKHSNQEQKQKRRSRQIKQQPQLSSSIDDSSLEEKSNDASSKSEMNKNRNNKNKNNDASSVLQKQQMSRDNHDDEKRKQMRIMKRKQQFDPTLPYRGAAREKQPIPYEIIQFDDDDDDIVRPKIYTFWMPVTPMEITGMPGTGMTTRADAALFRMWQNKWHEMGFEPHILTVDDAKRHKRYDEFMEQLQKVPLWGNRRAGVNREYNQACYIRWLAMAVVGGGFMSDYDVLPLRRFHKIVNLTDNNNDKFDFTTYQQGYTPCLLSGNAKSWEEMAWKILENGLAHPDDGVTTELWSDMMAFGEILNEQKQTSSSDNAPSHRIKLLDQVTEATPLLTGKPWTKQECAILRKYSAIHFSHHSIVSGVTRPGEQFRDRPKIAKRILNKIMDGACRVQ